MSHAVHNTEVGPGLISAGTHGNSVPLLFWQRELQRERSSHWNERPNRNAEFPTVPTGFQEFDKNLCNLQNSTHNL